MIVRDPAPALSLSRRFAQLRAAAGSGKPPSAAARRAHLDAIVAMLRRHSHEIAAAIAADFGTRSTHETRLLEIFPVLEAARHARRHVGRWMASQPRPLAPYFRPARARVVWQPLGVVGIVVPWNFPLLLALGPLVNALAAGNRAMIKMSEHTPHMAQLLGRLIGTAFAADHVRVETGAADIGRAFAALPFDHLLFTGSTTTGRSVMRTAAHQLTPITLELGGKSPAILGLDAPLERAAARIMAGKCRNAGQSCIAPDYVLLPHGRTDAFVAAARRAVRRLYPSLTANPDYTSIASDAQYDRLCELLADARAKGATVVPLHPDLPVADRTTRCIPPVAVLDVDDGMLIMQREVFGPVLPIRTYGSLDEAIGYVNARPHPLALYYFGAQAADTEAVLTRTQSGGACINDVMLQFAADDLPFGGVGASGMGAYHGRDGFERFSHKKAVFAQADRPLTGILEAPYGNVFAAVLRVLSR